MPWTDWRPDSWRLALAHPGKGWGWGLGWREDEAPLLAPGGMESGFLQELPKEGKE